MSQADVWLVILGGMAVTYATRLSFFLLPSETSFPPAFRRGLRLVAPAVLAGILAPQVLIPGGAQGIEFTPRVVAAAIAAGLGWKTRNAWICIGGGMAALWILQALFPTWA